MLTYEKDGGKEEEFVHVEDKELELSLNSGSVVGLNSPKCLAN